MAKKDPAFLFYSKDFYEGTRLMLPEERACLIDLMIFQHQNGGIPNDIKRLSLYCSGISQETIKHTLETKFVLIDTEWYSEKMTEVVTERKEKGEKNKLIGTFAYVLKKLNLSSKDQKILKSRFKVDELLKIDTVWDTERLTEWCLNGIPFIEDVNANEDISSLNSFTNTDFNFKKSLMDLGVEEKNASEWIKHRKKGKASDSERAFNKIKKEIELSGRNADDCIQICLGYKERTGKVWIGFEAEWIKNISSQNTNTSNKIDFVQPKKVFKTSWE